MKKHTLAAASAVAALTLLFTAGCTAEEAGGDGATTDSAFEALLASNPSDAFSETGLDLPDGFAAACDDLAAEYSDLSGKTYKMAVSGDSPPLAYLDELNPDRLLGYHPAMAELSMACLGLDFKYEFFDFAALGPAMEAGRADIQWRPIFFSEERAAVMDYVVYQQNSNDVMTAPDKHKDLKDFAGLCGLTVGVPGSSDVEHSFLDGDFDQYCTGGEKIDYLSFPNIAQQFQALAADKVDAIMLSNAASAGFSDIAVARFNDGTTNYAGPSVQRGSDELCDGILEAVLLVQDYGLQTQLLESYNAPANLYYDAEVMKLD